MFGAVILMISNVLVKIIGSFLRIPLTNESGTDKSVPYYSGELLEEDKYV